MGPEPVPQCGSLVPHQGSNLCPLLPHWSAREVLRSFFFFLAELHIKELFTRVNNNNNWDIKKYQSTEEEEYKHAIILA